MSRHSPASWKMRLLASLKHPGAPRVFAPAELLVWLGEQEIDVGASTVAASLPDWESAGLFLRVSRGLYANTLATPAVRPDEAAPRLRQGAVISLQRVLGENGVLNNPTPWVTAVVPTGLSAGTGNRNLETPFGTYRFANVKPEFLPPLDTTWANDALDPNARVPTATPEKALLDWLYLATVPNGRNPPLPPKGDVDLEALDEARLERLAAFMGLTAEWEQWTRPSQAPTHRRRWR